jgi:hypothetical protein
MAWWQTGLKIGAVALMSAPFFYEDEARRLQSRIDDLWQRSGRGEQRAIGVHNDVLHESASVLGDWLSRLFGDAWTSPRKILLLVVISVAAYIVFLWLMAKSVTIAVLNVTVVMQKAGIPQDPKPIAEMMRLNRQMDIASGPPMAGLYLGGAATAVLREPWRTWAALALMLIALANTGPVGRYYEHTAAAFYLTLLLGAALQSLVISILQRVIRRTQSLSTPRMLLYIVVAIAATVIPTAAWILISQSTRYTLPMIMVICSMNCIAFALLWAFFPVLLLVHRLFWTVVRRPLYFLMQNKVALDHKKAVFFVGLGFLSLAFPGVGAWLRSLIK